MIDMADNDNAELLVFEIAVFHFLLSDFLLRFQIPRLFRSLGMNSSMAFV